MTKVVSTAENTKGVMVNSRSSSASWGTPNCVTKYPERAALMTRRQVTNFR